MSDLIDRKEAVEAVKNEMLSWLEGDSHDYRKVVDAIMDVPTVDAVPVMHGRWESGRYRSVDQTGETYDDGEALICTNCRCGFRKSVVDWRWKYCPACGARMDGEG